VLEWFYNNDCRYFLPLEENEGFGNITFVSLCAGLNIAIAKIEAFTKSLQDVDSRFDKVETDFTKSLGLSEYLADEALFAGFKARTSKLLEKAKVDNKRRWDRARFWASTAAYAGGIAIFFRMSLGVAAILLLWPLFETWRSKRKSTTELTNSLTECIECFKEFAIQQLAANSSPRREEITRLLASGG
jgi:hypothetical protein